MSMPFKTPLDTRFRGYDGKRIQHFLSLQSPFLKKCRCSIIGFALLINPENILFYLRLSAQICGLNNFSKRSVV
jgi:hypothetical protein